jgi:hypothetical protein
MAYLEVVVVVDDDDDNVIWDIKNYTYSRKGLNNLIL